MSDKRRVLMTHYDMDGVGCDILLSKMWKFEKKYMSGYAKIKQKISQGDLKFYDSCVVSDICLTPEQYKDISSEYGDKFLLIDHHEPTKDALVAYNNGSNVIFSSKFCATALIFQSFNNKLKYYKDIASFVIAVDAYDVWRHKTHPENFEVGYDLNTLFWKYGYWDFFDRFTDNFSLKWSEEESLWIDEHKKKRDEAINKSDMNEFGDNSLLVLNITSDYVNDYTLQFPQYDVYYMVYVNADGKIVLSSRTSLEDVQLGYIVRDVRGMYDDILTAGGHPKSAGIDFKSTTPLDVILDVVEDINYFVETRNDVPEDTNGVVPF